MKKLVVIALVIGVPLMFAWLYPLLFEADAYTLYRNSATDIDTAGFSTQRIHIATFDANETGTYNQQNCDLASKLFKQQYGVTVNYWCEKGRYKR